MTSKLPFAICIPANDNSTTNLFDTTLQTPNSQTELLELEDGKPILEGICIDASCIKNSGKMEYRGVDIKTGKVIFE